MRMARAKVSQKQKNTLLIAVAILLVIAVIGVCVFRFGFPDKWDAFVARLLSKDYADGELRVHFLDVGQGDGIYIEFPDGADMLIDMGSTKGYSTSQAISTLNDLNRDDRIDHLMLTHTDQDHVEYLDDIIGAFEVANIYMPNVKAAPTNGELARQVEALDEDLLALFTDPDCVSTATYAKFFIAALSEENCTIHLNMDSDEYSNDIVIEGEGYTFTFYCPTAEFYQTNKLNTAEKLNAVSPVGILAFNGRRIVFTGDSNALNEPIIAERIVYLDCDVLKVAHHGSATSSCNEFLNAVNCEYAVISCGQGNDYGHPTQSALDRLKRQKMTVYRTDLNGDVTLTVDKSGNMNFNAERSASQSDIFVGADK